jgi:hypothetical protein
MRQSLSIILLFAGTAAAGELPIVPAIDVDPQQIAASDDPASGILPATDESFGWAFNVFRPLRITHLAWNDTDRNGLSHSHAVGIWRNTLVLENSPFNPLWPVLSENELVVETVIPAGTVAELNGSWRRVPVGPIQLEPGQYQIVGQNHAGSADDFVFWTPTNFFPRPTFAPGISTSGMSRGQPAFGPVQWGGWLPPGTFNGQSMPGALMGTMFFVRDIPEPPAFVLACACCIVFWLHAKRRGAPLSRERLLRLNIDPHQPVVGGVNGVATRFAGPWPEDAAAGDG